jgi:hypothetical protein
MPKLNYIRSLLDSLSPEKLREIMEAYAKSDRTFEAFVLEHSGKAVETGKSYQDYHNELMKIHEKCKSRKRGFLKVTRLKNAGMNSFQKLLQSHFKNENFSTALWMSLALMEMMHLSIMTNTRYSWSNKPYKSFEKVMLDCQDKLDTCFKLAPPTRKDRPEFFQALVRCWWNERQREYPQQYFDIESILKYAERDEDFITIKSSLTEFMKESGLSLTEDKPASLSTRLSKLFALKGDSPIEKQLSSDLKQIDDAITLALDSWD